MIMTKPSGRAYHGKTSRARLPAPDDWALRALCRDVPPAYRAAWCRDPENPEHADEIAFARALCSQCPVRSECLAHSLRHAEPACMWGGVDERERARLLKQQERGGAS